MIKHTVRPLLAIPIYRATTMKIYASIKNQKGLTFPRFGAPFLTHFVLEGLCF